MSFLQRSHGCGDLRASHVGQTVSLNGWVHKLRHFGGLAFVDLRDRTGIVQLIVDAEFGNTLKPETCIAVRGEVISRSEETKNPKLGTGDVEIKVSHQEVLGVAKALPFQVSDEAQMESVNEELRVKHRYIDLRRPVMYRRMAMRAFLIRQLRAYLDERQFIETETPIITRSTPEGARDYLVAYRLKPGQWYALPQSPQQYKQLLMVAGLERYYQIAKCFRDESQRADRQPEFTQLDLEMSFVTQEDILTLAENLIRESLNATIAEFDLGKEKIAVFPRITYDESMRRYGNDKPDLRFELELFDLTEALKNTEFGVFKSTIASGGSVRGVRYPTGASLSRREVGEVEELAKSWGAKGLATLQVFASGDEGVVAGTGKLGVKGSFAKFLSPVEIDATLAASSAEAGDLLCFAADTYVNTNTVLSRLRLEIGQRLGLRDPRKLAFCWVIDFPLVEWDEETKSWSPSHHPFTSPKFADLEFLDSDPGRVRADCYDMVCNGSELASGSIRIHKRDIQAKIFTLLGIDEATQQSRFGHILEAFSYGAPPHGGIAPGIDRMVMILSDTENIREVIAFPKMGNGYDPMMDAPSEIDEAQWKELGLTQPSC